MSDTSGTSNVSGQSILNQIPYGLGKQIEKKAGGATSTPVVQLGDENQAANLINGLTEGQQGNPSQALVWQLGNLMSQLPASQANQLMSQLPEGSGLATSLGYALNPSSAPAPATAAETYGFDPLNVGQLFTQTLGPWLAGQQKQDNTALNGLSSQLQTALKGASPQVQQAYSVSEPALNESLQATNAATKDASATAPGWDSLILALTNASNSARLAQAYAQGEPYFAATTGTGTVPTSGASANAASEVQQIANSIAQTRAG